ncbi:MAG: hypothetical protein WCC27_05925 [Acidobacteriaceae bacterium]
MSTSDLLAGASLAVSIAALLIAYYAIIRANKTTSGATAVALSEGFRESWVRFLDNPNQYELAELLNLIEIACAIYLEGSLAGNSRKLMFEYLNATLGLIINNPYANNAAEHLLQNPKTLEFIRKFLRLKARSLSVTVPPKWYELPIK